ncbi:GntR family transcriptional regulator [Rheinheimera pleomorphica]|uniref:GntR family transcriptional regulator n=1 Tax=Rheinheimera pleomorphica TaxID=2703963 RepID=UPI0014238043|nr:GntR family transcriptional regulator [Rheinheimera pleomorphica]
MLKKQQLYQQLKQDIQLQHWAPAQVLTQQQLAAHYSVSRIVVRDAQQQLISEGWLSAHGKAGMQVAPFSVAEAEELCMLRLQLEPLALRLAASELSFSQLGQAEDVLRQLAQQTNMPSYQRGELNWQFHRLLYQPCGKVHLLRLLDQLHQQVARYLGYQEQVLAYTDTSAAEHQQLINLLRQRQTDAACHLLQQHICDASALLTQHLKNRQGA